MYWVHLCFGKDVRAVATHLKSKEALLISVQTWRESLYLYQHIPPNSRYWANFVIDYATAVQDEADRELICVTLTSHGSGKHRANLYNFLVMLKMASLRTGHILWMVFSINNTYTAMQFFVDLFNWTGFTLWTALWNEMQHPSLLTQARPNTCVMSFCQLFCVAGADWD